MKIRTQLVLAFLLLSVVPLTGIVLYSYVTSQRAVRRAVESEAAEMNQEMSNRMAMVKVELGRSVERVGEIPFATLLERGGDERGIPQVMRAIGETAPLVDALEFRPAPAAVPSGEAPEMPEAPESPETPEASEMPEAPEAAEASEAPAPAPPVPPVAPMVIDVKQILEEIHKAQKEMPRGEHPELQGLLEQTMEIAADSMKDFNPTGRPGWEGKVVFVHPEELEKKLAEVEARGADVEKRMALLERRRRESRLIFGKEIEAPVKEKGRVVGWVRAQVRPEEVLRRVLGRSRREKGEIPFAIDSEGKVYAVSGDDQQKIQGLSLDLPRLAAAQAGTSSQKILDGWVVVTSKDPDSGLTLGVARPIRQSLAEVKATAARNFGYGLALIAVALVGILPLSNRMTRDVSLLKQGAEKIAEGDLETQVPVRSRNEIGALAAAFNRMAGDLRSHQERLVVEERRRQEQETEQRLLRSEYDRKTLELEEARSFQLSLLPKSLPDHPAFEIAVSMQTATEVGGDYYDFHLGSDPEGGALTVAVGDATGHGARAGTMVTVVKSLFSADCGRSAPREFLAEAAGAVKRMELGRMAMGLTLAKLSGSVLTLAAAGMPPALLYRSGSRQVDEIALEGMPLGGLAYDYQEVEHDVNSGDVLLLMSDGLPELHEDEGEPFGYPRVRGLFQELGERTPEDIIAGLADAARAWVGGKPPNDDVTFVVVRLR